MRVSTKYWFLAKSYDWVDVLTVFTDCALAIETSLSLILHNCLMANTYLIVPFKDKDAAKSLGARWDAVQRPWYVPDGRELTTFLSWLPARSTNATAAARGYKQRSP